MSENADTEVSREYSRDKISQLISTVHPAFKMIIDRSVDYQNIDPITMIADNVWVMIAKYQIETANLTHQPGTLFHFRASPCIGISHHVL